MSPFQGPIRAQGDGFVISIGAEEGALVRRLIGELRTMLTDPEPDNESQVLLARLFPAAYLDDDEMEAEYQRLMRDELVQSKLASFDLVEQALADDGSAVDEAGVVALMQSLNSVRLVLGTMLGVTDDPNIEEVSEGLEDSPEYHLYTYLSWLLEWCVRALTGRD